MSERMHLTMTAVPSGVGWGIQRGGGGGGGCTQLTCTTCSVPGVHHDFPLEGVHTPCAHHVRFWNNFFRK